MKNFKRFGAYFTLVGTGTSTVIYTMNPDRKNFGRPVKKESRRGQWRLNKNGHRKNKSR